MGCFFPCFRMKDENQRTNQMVYQSISTTNRDLSVSRHQLGSLFLAEDKNERANQMVYQSIDNELKNEIEDAHQLRLLYNRNLQWLFVNALSDVVSAKQKMAAEDTLYIAWSRISELDGSIISKKINLQYREEEVKLNMVLKEQMAYLEDWATLEKEHSSLLSAATKALKASTLRLPVTDGARVDACAVKNAISYAVDVMHAMGSSVCCLLSKVEGMNHLASELSDTAAKERAMLDECRDLLSSTAAIQVRKTSGSLKGKLQHPRDPFKVVKLAYQLNHLQ